ncbi:hypothetical protein [Rickettsia sp. TH2014]|uniref:hypothetical protein n=1 Tax=Rickettsia sp. TH2014 TaxID=1967503 RepID=UPI001C48310E|nr:hypothetical protein [Rickettsia sp. TH2014]
MVIYASFVLGVGFFLYCIFDSFRQSKDIRNIGELFGVDVIIFILGMIAYYIFVKDYPSYYFWDEYSHWGLTLKETNIYHGFRLPNDPTSVINKFNGYAKLASIFQYSINKIIGFKESLNVFANGFLYFIFCSVALVEKRLLLGIFLYLMLILFSMYDIIVSINSLHVDATVGCIFGATIAIYLQSKKYNNILLSLVLISPLLFILPNIKEVGYWLSYIAIFIITVDLIFNKKYSNLWVIIILLLPILSNFIWCNYVNSLCIETVCDFECTSFKQVPFASIYNLLLINSEQVAIVKLIISYMVHYASFPEVCYIYGITAIAIIFIWQNSREQLKNFLRVYIILLIGFVLYIVFRIDLYLTKFISEKAKVAACYSRYFNSYTYVFCFVTISFIKNSFDNSNLNFRSLIWFYIIAIILSVMSLKNIVHKLKDVSILSNVASDPIVRQNKIKALIKNGIKDGSEFKENNFKLLDCYIYNYLEAPNTDNNILLKCLEDRQGIF